MRLMFNNQVQNSSYSFTTFECLRCETHLKIYKKKSISINIYLPQLVRLEGKLDFQGNRDFQTRNLGFLGHFDPF